MSRTAKLASKIFKIPLTTSIHTDTPPYARYYIEKILKKLTLFKLGEFLIQKKRVPEIYEKKMFNKVCNYIKLCNSAMVADKIYSPTNLKKITGNKHITKLNRGINKKVFNQKKNKHNIFKKYGISENDKLIFFSGRIHELKGALLLANIHKSLLRKKKNITTLMAGDDIHGDLCKKIAPKKIKTSWLLKSV